MGRYPGAAPVWNLCRTGTRPRGPPPGLPSTTALKPTLKPTPTSHAGPPAQAPRNRIPYTASRRQNPNTFGEQELTTSIKCKPLTQAPRANTAAPAPGITGLTAEYDTLAADMLAQATDAADLAQRALRLTNQTAGRARRETPVPAAPGAPLSIQRCRAAAKSNVLTARAKASAGLAQRALALSDHCYEILNTRTEIALAKAQTALHDSPPSHRIPAATALMAHTDRCVNLVIDQLNRTRQAAADARWAVRDL